MTFRDDIDAARARIGSLEASLEETQRTLEALRVELETERASRRSLPDPLEEYRAEIQGLKARLRAAGADGVQPTRRLIFARRLALVGCLVAIGVASLHYLLLPVVERVRDERASTLHELASCRESLRRVATDPP